MRKLCILLCLCLLLSGCTANVGEHMPTGDGLSYGDDYTGPQNKPDTQEKPQHFSLASYKDLPCCIRACLPQTVIMWWSLSFAKASLCPRT